MSASLADRWKIALGLAAMNEWSDEELLAHMQRAAPTYDRYMRANPGVPTRITITVRFGSWHLAMDAAGLPRNPGGRPRGSGNRWTAGELAEWVARCSYDIGKPPTVQEYEDWHRGEADSPCCAHIRRELGGWMVALELAGVGDGYA